MNRSERRRQEYKHKKSIKSKMDKQQFEELLKHSKDLTIQKEVEARIKNFFDFYVPVMYGTLRNNRIGEERTQKIIDEIIANSKKRARGEI